MIGNKYSKHLQIYTDGSKNPENGNTACAFVVPELNHTEMYKLDTNLTVLLVWRCRWEYRLRHNTDYVLIRDDLFVEA